MRPFRYERPGSVADAVAAGAAPGAAFLGGGTNLVDHLRLGVAGPDVLVDVTGLPLDRVEERPDGGVRVGAEVRNSDLAANPVVRSRYPAVSAALLSGASGQIRNAATTAGNLLQRTRCVYFQDVSLPCNKRSPGSGCAAIGGYARYHAVLGGSPHCVAVHPSDLAVALAAFDASVHVVGVDGERDVPMTEFHRLPGGHPERDTVLRRDELVVAVDLPAQPIDRRSAYRKVRDRASYAFALVSVAAAVDLADGVVRDVRLALGGVAHRPWRAYRAEHLLRGGPADVTRFRQAAQDELSYADPLPDNAFKVPLAVNTVVAVLRDLTGVAS